MGRHRDARRAAEHRAGLLVSQNQPQYQRQPPWVRFHAVPSGHTFYFEETTGASTWETPRGVPHRPATPTEQSLYEYVTMAEHKPVQSDQLTTAEQKPHQAVQLEEAAAKRRRVEDAWVWRSYGIMKGYWHP